MTLTVVSDFSSEFGLFSFTDCSKTVDFLITACVSKRGSCIRVLASSLFSLFFGIKKAVSTKI